MRKRKLTPPTPPTPAVTTNGLCAEDAQVLRVTLAELETYGDRLHLMGSREREEWLLVEARVKVRLSPPPIQPLVEAAQRVISKYGMTLNAGRAATLRREAELVEINAQRLAAREARAKLVAARAAERERQQLEARLLWQGRT